MSHILVGQASGFAPAVLFHNNQYHMVFADRGAGDLLHAVSNDGKNNWTRKRPLRQSTNHAPALFEDRRTGLMVCVFTAANESNMLLSCNYEDRDDNWT